VTAATPRRMAYFISSHGFGHAARAAAVMAALHALDPTIHFDIFTQVPAWFFQDSLHGAFRHADLCTDIGLVQKSPLHEDLAATVQRLEAFLPFDPALVRCLAAQLHSNACALVLCDIAALGITVAQAAGIPAVLVENFTWDWIYQGYLADEPRLAQFIAYLRGVFTTADYHIQTEPACCPGSCDLVARPVSRPGRMPRQQTRQQLGIPAQARAVLLTMGGIPDQYTFLHQLAQHAQTYFVVPGASTAMQTHANTVLLPFRSAFLHSDLVRACDAVVGKVGYSTLAEVYYAGVPFGYIARQRFRESPVFATYIATHMSGFALSEADFYTGAWLARLPELLALPQQQRLHVTGAEQIAHFVYGLVHSEPGPARRPASLT
jgi:hypothetical protein